MDQNRYDPPRTPLARIDREPGPIPKAVAIGAAIDIGGTMLGGMAIGILYSILLGMQGHSNEDIERALTKFDPWSWPGLLLIAMGLTMSALGGYRCAVIANRPTYLAPGILSLISVTFGAAMNDTQYQLQDLLLMSGLTVAAILGAASLHIRRLQVSSANANS